MPGIVLMADEIRHLDKAFSPSSCPLVEDMCHYKREFKGAIKNEIWRGGFLIHIEEQDVSQQG